MQAPDVPLATANAARQQAVVERSRALMSVTRGEMSIWDVISKAGTSRPIGKIHLRQLLLAQEGWGPAQANAALRRTVRTAAVNDARLATLSIDWLLDPRAGGRRQLAFSDAVCSPRTGAPWSGFPSTPIPSIYEEAREAWTPAA